LVYCGSDKPGISPITTVASPSGKWSTTPTRPRVPSVRVSGAMLDRLRKGELASLELRVQGKREVAAAFNVIGTIRRRRQRDRARTCQAAIVISAHYDHLDLAGASRRPAARGRDHQRRDDDASGCSAVLELAEAFGAGAAPARTWCSSSHGEEIGLLGTDWTSSTRSCVADTVCNLNFRDDRPPRSARRRAEDVFDGYELSNLGPEFANGRHRGRARSAEGELLRRSDNIRSVNRASSGRRFHFNMHTDYHHVSDEATSSTTSNGRLRQSGLECARMLASGALTPAWNPGTDPSKR